MIIENILKDFILQIIIAAISGWLAYSHSKKEIKNNRIENLFLRAKDSINKCSTSLLSIDGIPSPNQNQLLTIEVGSAIRETLAFIEAVDKKQKNNPTINKLTKSYRQAITQIDLNSIHDRNKISSAHDALLDYVVNFYTSNVTTS